MQSPRSKRPAPDTAERKPPEIAGVKIAASIAPDDMARAVADQRAMFRDMADAVERGEPLTGYLAKIAGAALRSVADGLTTHKPRKVGHKSEFDRGEALIFYHIASNNGLSKTAAFERVADIYGVTRQSIEKKLGKDAT